MSSRVVEQIKDKVDIVDAIGRVVTLRKSGRSWSGLCPFHSEKTGSFHVYDDGHFHCFGCHINGDVITFYEKYYHLEFKEACERIGAEFGIDIKWEKSGGENDSREALFSVNADAANHYYMEMKKEGNAGLEYLSGRGISRETIKAFGLGYADGSGRSFAAKLAGMSPEKRKAAEEAGLVYEYGGGLCDRYRDRVIFPIVNTRGKVIGFGARDLTGNPKAGKYINSKESRAFSKGHNLYALYKAQTAIRDKNFAILVEGYMDAIALHMQGIENAVAQLGTAFTREQAKLLLRYTKNVTLCLDSDESGKKAAEESGQILQSVGIKAKVLILEGAKDPDEFVRTFGKERFEEAAKNAIPLTDYRLERLKEGFAIDTDDGKADFMKAAVNLFASLEPVERAVYIKKIARETGIAEEAFQSQAERIERITGGRRESVVSTRKDERREAGKTMAKVIPLFPKVTEFDKFLAEILAYPLNEPECLKQVQERRHLFANSVYNSVFDALFEAGFEESGAISIEKFKELANDDDAAIFENVLEIAGRGGDWSLRGLDELLFKTEIAILKKKDAELLEIQRTNGGADVEIIKERDEILREIKALEDGLRRGKFT